MLTWGSKYLFGLSGFALVGAIVYGLVTGGDPVGVISAGYKGGVGDHLGYAILLAVSTTSLVLAATTIITRDGDAEEMAARAGVAGVPAVSPPATGSVWGIVTAFGVSALIIGVAVNQAFFYLGIAVLFVTGLNWLVLAWSDRATGDPAVNEVIRRRVLGPVEIPMIGMLIIAVIAIGMAQIFLTVSKEGAVVAGSIATILVFGGAVIMSKIDVKRNVMSGIVVLGAAAVLVGGIVGAARGPRDFEHHHEEDHSEEGIGAVEVGE